MTDRQRVAVDDGTLAQMQEGLRSQAYSFLGPVGPDGTRRLGAYGFSSRNWSNWAAAAGLPGADWRDPAAQDRVADFLLKRYRDEFGTSKLVSTAWAAGPAAARAAQGGGRVGDRTIEFVKDLDTRTSRSPAPTSNLESSVPDEPPLMGMRDAVPLRQRAQESLTNTLYTMRENVKRQGVVSDGSDE